MNILILEDDIFQQQKLEQIIKDIMVKKKRKYKNLYSTAKPDSLLARIDTAARHQIYFLDIEIKDVETKGMEVAQQIRAMDKFGTIVFVTTHSEFAPATFGYRVAALDFIDKDSEEDEFIEKVEACLDVAYEAVDEPVSKDAFVFENQNTAFQLPFSEIFYFETTEISHKLRLITKDRTMTFYGDMKEIEKKDKRLVRCHRSFIINIENVVRINKEENLAEFGDDFSAMISRRLLRKTSQLLVEQEEKRAKAKA